MKPARLHFVGVGGSGMSALAQYSALRGVPVSGSDRSFDRGEAQRVRAVLERVGVRMHPQDGSAVDETCAAVVASTAVESAIPDLVRARALGLPVLHRSELLARWVAERRTVAVAGTSGKSTVAAMVFDLLRGAGQGPSLLTGAELQSLRSPDRLGSAWVGASDLLVVEADESDGSLVRYAPSVSVVLNVSRDHQECAETLALFETLRSHTREAFLVGDADALRPLHSGAIVFGLGPTAEVRAERVELGAASSRFVCDQASFEIPLPGRHNAENALAAIAVCRALGVPHDALVEPLRTFAGVVRRFHSVGRRRDVEVIDDYAHNPAKIEATLCAARPRGKRLLVVFQPHGFGPLRLLRSDLARAFSGSLSPDDRLYLLDVFYAGGTASKDVSSEDLARDVRALGRHAQRVPSRRELVAQITEESRAGDVVLVLGARDDSLSDLALDLLAALEG